MRTIRSFRRVLRAAAACAILLGARAAGACEPDSVSAAIDSAADARIAGNLPVAETLINRILAVSPQLPRAQYVSSLIIIDQAGKDTAKIVPALEKMRQVADALPDYNMLPAAQKTCRENPRLYAVFNTVGVTYHKLGDRTTAEKYYLRGQTNLAALSRQSQAKVLSNLGLLYLNNLNLSKSQAYYTRAEAAGSASAASRLTAIQQMKSLK